jgi:hypothetical protein
VALQKRKEQLVNVLGSGPMTPGIYKKIIEVMREVDGVAKTGRNEFHRYNYATEADLLDKIRDSLINHGLVVLPTQVETTYHPNDGGMITEIIYEFRLVDVETGETFASRVVGQGQDKGDKGAYKAFTGAMKYFLLKTFLIPTNDDPENDSTPNPAPGFPQRRNAVTPTRVPAPGSQRTATATRAPQFSSADEWENATVRCDNFESCGNEIKATSRYSVESLVDLSRKAHQGRVLCRTCSQAAKSAGN